MTVKVLGIKNIDYTNKSGRQVTGTELHVTYKDNRVFGEAVEKFYISSAINDCKMVKVGKVINLFFNQFGKVDFLQIAD